MKARVSEQVASARPVPRILHAEVVDAYQLTPRMRRIVLGNGDLPTFESVAPDQFAYVFLPRPGVTGPPVAHDFTWDAWRDAAPEDRAIGRYYTIRRHDAERALLELDVVQHSDGPGSAWATTTKPGDWVALWAPRVAYNPPADTDWLLLAADHTGLPALAAILESLPPDACARAFVEIPDDAEQQPLSSPADAELMWLHRGATPPGECSLLVDAVRSLAFEPGQPYAWCAGEADAMTALRKYLRDEKGLTNDRMSVVGYWRAHGHEDDDA